MATAGELTPAIQPMRLKHFLARILGPFICVAASSGCSNDVRQVPVNEVRAGGTYVVAALETMRPASKPDLRVMIPPNAVVSYPVTPPNVWRDQGPRKLAFVRAESNYCVGSDELVIDFPPPESGVRYVAFSLPPGHYVGRATLRAGENDWTEVPIFAVERGEAAYLGRLTLESNGDVSIGLDAAEARRHAPMQLRPIELGKGRLLPRKICTP